MNRALLAVIALLVLLGGLAAAFFALDLGGGGEADPAAQTDEDGVLSGRITFISLQPMRITLLRGDRVDQFLQVEVVLEVHGKRNADHVEERLGPLQSVVLEEMQSYINLQIEETGTFDLEQLKRRLLLVTQRITGDGRIEGVLLGNIVGQRPR